MGSIIKIEEEKIIGEGLSPSFKIAIKVKVEDKDEVILYQNTINCREFFESDSKLKNFRDWVINLYYDQVLFVNPNTTTIPTETTMD